METQTLDARYTCLVCALPFEKIEPGQVLVCTRCGSKDKRLLQRSTRLSMAFALTALILYVPANFFPFMTLEMYGSRNSTTILGGVISLLDQRSYVVGIIVFLASVLIPVMKLLILFYLSASARNGQHQLFKMNLYQMVEAIGRWSMLDIFLLAILVALVKLGHWAQVEPEIGSVLFALVVVFTMMASAYFDPRTIWEPQDAKINTP